MNARDKFLAAVSICQELWNAQAEINREYRNFLRRDQKLEAASYYKRRQAIVHASAVRLATSWEVFLDDLFREFLTNQPESFKKVWKFRGKVRRVTPEMLDKMIRDARHPFQDSGRMRGFLQEYLGSDLFETRGGGKVNLRVVEELLEVRHAIVHKGGLPTKKYREKLSTRKHVHTYLLSKPGTRAIPATQFDRLLTGVMGAVADLYARTWANPRV